MKFVKLGLGGMLSLSNFSASFVLFDMNSEKDCKNKVVIIDNLTGKEFELNKLQKIDGGVVLKFGTGTLQNCVLKLTTIMTTVRKLQKSPAIKDRSYLILL